MKNFKLALVATTILTSQINTLLAEAETKVAGHVAHTADAHKGKDHYHAHIVAITTKDVIEKSKFGVDVQAKMTKEQQELTKHFPALQKNLQEQEAALVAQDKELRKEAEELESKATLLSPEVRMQKIEAMQEKRSNLEDQGKKFQKAATKFQQDAQNIDKRLMDSYQREMQALEVKIRTIIDELSLVHGWDVVLTKESTIYTSAKIDVTAQVIAKLDAVHAQEAEKNKAAVKEAAEKVKKADEVITQAVNKDAKK